MKITHDTLVESLINNAMHAAKLTTFTALGIASQVTLPTVGTAVNTAVPVGLFGLNLAHDIYKAGHVGIEKPSDVRDVRHDMVADSVISGAIAAGATYYVKSHPEMAVPVIGFLALADVLLAGDNSPIEYMKDYIHKGLDYIPFI